TIGNGGRASLPLTCERLKKLISADLYGARNLVSREIIYVLFIIADVTVVIISWVALWGKFSDVAVQTQKIITVVTMILAEMFGSILLVGAAVLVDYQLKTREEDEDRMLPCSGGDPITFVDRWYDDTKNPEHTFIKTLVDGMGNVAGQAAATAATAATTSTA